jgi:hypothetical protein
MRFDHSCHIAVRFCVDCGAPPIENGPPLNEVFRDITAIFKRKESVGILLVNLTSGKPFFVEETQLSRFCVRTMGEATLRYGWVRFG